MEWLPINTLPLGGATVIVYVPRDKRPVFEAEAFPDGSFEDPTYSEWDGNGATHWMPLPMPPEEV